MEIIAYIDYNEQIGKWELVDEADDCPVWQGSTTELDTLLGRPAWSLISLHVGDRVILYYELVRGERL